MKRNSIISLALGLSLVAMVGCSKSDDASISAPEAAKGFKAANDTIDGASGLIPNSLTRSAGGFRVAGTMTDIWTDTFLPDPRCSGGGSDPHCGGGSPSTIRDLMGFMTDADAVRDNGSSINIFGRLKSATKSTCAVTSILAYSNAGVLPTSGTHTVTFTTATNILLSTYCGMSDDDIPEAGTEATAVVTPTTDTTYYDSKIDITIGGETFSILLRINSTAMNVATSEANGGTNYSRTWVALNRTTGVVRADYASYSSNSPGSGETHRLYYDSVSNSGSMVGATYDFNSPANRYVFAMVGKPGAGGQTALSLSIQGFGLTGADAGASTSSLNHYKACINGSTGAIATNDSVACAGGVTGVNGGTNGLATAFTTFVTAVNGNGPKLIAAAVYGETHSVPFTSASDIFTVAFPIAP